MEVQPAEYTGNAAHLDFRLARRISRRPWLGVWQRINIVAYMVWIAVLAITLLRSRAPAGPTDGRELLQ